MGVEHINKQARRCFPEHGLSDGIITAVLPSECNEDVTLWHMVHNDADEEDLELDGK